MSVIRSAAPQLSIAQAAVIAKTLYGLDHFVRELPSERDKNFLFRDNRGDQFILKVANADEKPEVLDLQNQAIRHVGGLLRVIPTRDDEFIANVEGHLIRLVNFVPGIALADFQPHSADLLEELGRVLGRTDKRLASFRHPSARRELYWDIRNAERVVTLEEVLQSWRDVVVPRMPKLRTSVIHNDANDYNVIVSSRGMGVTPALSLIDFGDMLETYTVAEPAIACAYVMMHKPDPVAAA